MKNTFGKLGYGLSGAVAAIGLMSAGVQTANAEIVATAPSPVETLGAIIGGQQTYDFTYYLQFGAAGTTLLGSGGTNQASIALTLDGVSSDVYSLPTLTVTNGGITSAGFGTASYTGADLHSGDTYSWLYTGSSYTSSGTEAIGYITVATTTQYGLVPSSNNFSTVAARSVSTYPPSGLSDDNIAQVAVPNATSDTPLAPLALPVAVWPGLLTLAGMVVAGGLKMRRRSFNVH